MGILNKIGIGKGEEKDEKKEEKKEKEADKKEEKPEKQQKSVKITETKTAQAHRILVRPILSEKAVMLANMGEYIFEVDISANKNEIGKSIEQVYGVNVKEVKTMRVPGKQRRYGRTTGRTSSWKKAIVKLEKGEKIPGIIESVG